MSTSKSDEDSDSFDFDNDDAAVGNCVDNEENVVEEQHENVVVSQSCDFQVGDKVTNRHRAQGEITHRYVDGGYDITYPCGRCFRNQHCQRYVPGVWHGVCI